MIQNQGYSRRMAKGWGEKVKTEKRLQSYRRTPENIRGCHIRPQTKQDKSEEGTCIGKPVGRCEVVERNRRRFHGLVEEFRVSRVQNEQTDIHNVVGSSDHTGGSKRLSPREMECNAKEVGLPTISIEEMGTVARIKIGVGLFHCTESTYG